MQSPFLTPDILRKLIAGFVVAGIAWPIFAETPAARSGESRKRRLKRRAFTWP